MGLRQISRSIPDNSWRIPTAEKAALRAIRAICVRFSPWMSINHPWICQKFCFLIITSLWSVGLRQISRSFFLHEWQRQRNRKTEGFMPPWNVGGHRQNVLCWIKKDTEGLLSARTMVRLWHLRQTIGLRHLRGCAFIYTAHPLVFYDWNVYLYFRLNRFGTCSFCLKTLFEPEFWHDLLEFVCVDNSLMRSSIVQNYSKTRGMQNKVAFWGQ